MTIDNGEDRVCVEVDLDLEEYEYLREEAEKEGSSPGEMMRSYLIECRRQQALSEHKVAWMLWLSLRRTGRRKGARR
jgi:hypothetical protein